MPRILLATFAFFCMNFAQAIVAENENTFSNESELGLVLTSGNSETQSWNAKQNNSYIHEKDTYKAEGKYLKSSSGSQKTAESWLFGLRYERALNTDFSLFVAQNIEGDSFAGYDQRRNTDIGAKYNIIKHDDFYWLLEAGYRYTHTDLTTGGTEYSNGARVYTETQKKWTETTSGKFWIEYLPSFTDSEDYFVNAELSLSSALSSTFSVKTAYLAKYMNIPGAAGERTDTTFTTSLVAKF